ANTLLRAPFVLFHLGEQLTGAALGPHAKLGRVLDEGAILRSSSVFRHSGGLIVDFLDIIDAHGRGEQVTRGFVGHERVAGGDVSGSRWNLRAHGPLVLTCCRPPRSQPQSLGPTKACGAAVSPSSNKSS